MKMRIPTTEEWDQLMVDARYSNSITHWEGAFSWVDAAAGERPESLREVRGCNSSMDKASRYGVGRYEWTGFRPAFEGLDTDNLIPDENGVISVGTLYMAGMPVRVPQNPVWDGDIEDYIPGATLTFGPALDDPAYVVRAIKVGDVYVADRVLLVSISCRDIEKATAETADSFQRAVIVTLLRNSYVLLVPGNERDVAAYTVKTLRAAARHALTREYAAELLGENPSFNWGDFVKCFGRETEEEFGFYDLRDLYVNANDAPYAVIDVQVEQAECLLDGAN